MQRLRKRIMKNARPGNVHSGIISAGPYQGTLHPFHIPEGWKFCFDPYLNPQPLGLEQWTPGYIFRYATPLLTSDNAI